MCVERGIRILVENLRAHGTVDSIVKYLKQQNSWLNELRGQPFKLQLRNAAQV